jgi:hypothetical protein
VPLILRLVKMTISVQAGTFARVDAAAARLGISRSEFYARGAERWLAEPERPNITEAIDAAIAGAEQDTRLTDQAAAEPANRGH